MGAAPGSTPADLELTATIGGLAPGTYTATVTVTGDDAEPTAMQVTLDLQPDGGTDPTDPDPDPQLILITEDVTFTATEGGADPDPRPVQVASSGEPVSGLSASISYGPGASDWLTVMLGGDTTPTDLELAAAIVGLAPGTYTATVTVTGTDALPAELQVTLDLQAGGGSGPGGPDPDTQLELSADDVSFTATEGSADPDPQTAIVTSSGDPVDALAVAITYGPGGVGWLNATLASTTTPADLELAAAIAGLAPGTYTATVTVTGTDALPAELQVTLDLQADGGAPGDPDADLIGLRLEIGADALAGGGLLELDLAQLLSDPILGFTVWALYSDSTKQDVTTLATATTSDPLLTLDGPGVLNLAGVLVNALIDPDHYLHVEYEGFVAEVDLSITLPLLGELSIIGISLADLAPGASLGVGTSLPNVLALLDDGLGGTVELLIPGDHAGVTWDIQPQLFDCGLILDPLCGLANVVLSGLGNLAGGLLEVTGGVITGLELGLLGGILEFLGGTLKADISAVVEGIVSDVVEVVIPL